MTETEISDSLWRNPSVYALVVAHKLLVASGEWSQVYTAPDWGQIDIASLPIPPQGYTYVDDRFGNVVIFPGADGKLFFNTNVPESAAAAVALPLYTSPSGITPSQILADIGELIAKATSLAMWVALAFGAVMLYRELR